MILQENLVPIAKRPILEQIEIRLRPIHRSFQEHPSIWVALFMLIATLIVYLPYLNNMSVVYRHYDGPFYMYVAKTFYFLPENAAFKLPFPKYYYAIHLPLYPLLIRILTLVTAGNYPIAMVIATIISSIASAILFLKLLESWKLVSSPFWTTFLFCFLPPRWLIYHSVGASEPLFFCFVFAAFLALHRGKTWIVILSIALASLTRITGVLLIPVFGMIYLLRRDWRSLILLPIAGIGILGLFTLYHFAFNDFFAYFSFNATGSKPIIYLDPLKIFRFYASKMNFHSTELYFALYATYGAGTLLLWKRKELFLYCAVFFVFYLFVYNWDFSRYFLAMAPFAIFVAFDPVLSDRRVRFVLVPLLLYLAFIYAWGWLPYPVLPEDGYVTLLKDLNR